MNKQSICFKSGTARVPLESLNPGEIQKYDHDVGIPFLSNVTSFKDRGEGNA